MIVLPAGEFMMGSPASENGHADVEGLPRRVTISRQIAMGKFEVTVEQMSAFIAETGMNVGGSCHLIPDPSRTVAVWGEPTASMLAPGFAITPSHPAVCISWHDAQSYVAWLQRRTGKPYRLPTEAEWEYAARAGTSTRYSFGNDETSLCGYARFADLGSQFGWGDGCRNNVATYGTAPVGSLKPNPWGLFDMHGNVAEWVLDAHDKGAYAALGGHAANPVRWPSEPYPHVVRGGSWDDEAPRLRSAARRGSSSGWKVQDPQIPKSIWYLTNARFVGFRVVRPLHPPPPEEWARYFEPEVDSIREVLEKQRQGGR
jgi:formylglycine-generating enzyme required for sulfatase activity